MTAAQLCLFLLGGGGGTCVTDPLPSLELNQECILLMRDSPMKAVKKLRCLSSYVFYLWNHFRHLFKREKRKKKDRKANVNFKNCCHKAGDTAQK